MPHQSYFCGIEADPVVPRADVPHIGPRVEMRDTSPSFSSQLLLKVRLGRYASTTPSMRPMICDVGFRMASIHVPGH